MNNIKEFNISNKMLKEKAFSYKILINLLYLCNYSVRDGEWFLYDIRPDQLKKQIKVDSRTIKSKLNHKIYKIKEDEFGINHLYIKKPTKNFIVVKRENVEKILCLDEMTIRLYLLVVGWKYEKINCLTQELVLDLIGYSSKSTVNKQKITNCRRILCEMGLIKADLIKRDGRDYIVYRKIK